jgi:hypothetical protein
MFPAFLIRTAIDWVRQNESYLGLSPKERCEQAVKTCHNLWEEEFGLVDKHLVEPSVISAYWAEVFHSSESPDGEDEWKEGILKRSSQYDSFVEWQEWFKQNNSSVYKDDLIWNGLIASAWAHTHQYDVMLVADSWEFVPATSYLPINEIWRFEPHMAAVTELMYEIWQEEKQAYAEIGFEIGEAKFDYLGKFECLGFDTKKYFAIWPAKAKRDKEIVAIGEIVADIIFPTSDDWYRALDNVIFAHDSLDVTSLLTRAQYVFGSKRRLMELTAESGIEQAIRQAKAEGWLVTSEEENASSILSEDLGIDSADIAAKV